MKKAYSFRLSEEAILAIRIRQKELGLKSEGAAVEAIVMGGGTYDVPKHPVSSGPVQPVHWNTVPAAPPFDLPPRPATLEGKKAAALAALGNMGKAALLDEVGAVAVPSAPFDVNIEGEAHRVTMVGKRLGLFYLGSGEPTFSRYLEQGEMEKLWEARIK